MTSFNTNLQSCRSAVVALASLSPRMDEGDVIGTLLAAPEDRLLDALLLQGSCRTVIDRIASADPALADRLCAREPLRSRLDRIRKVDEGIEGCLELLKELGLSLGISVYGIKGVASRRFYDKPEARELGDVDVMVRDAEQAWALTAAMLDVGYEYDERELPWIKRDTGAGIIYGQINLRYKEAGARPNIDLHYGGYSVRHCARLPFPGRSDEPGLAYYTRDENLGLVVGNAAGDHWVSTKDLNDLYLALNDPDVAWGRVLRDLASVGLLSFLGQMLRQLRDEFALVERSRLVLDGLIARCGREIPPPGAAKSWNRRLLSTCRHAGAVGMRESPVTAARNVWTAFRYYRRPMSLKIDDAQQPFRIDHLDARTCVLLVPTRVLAEHGVVASPQDGSATSTTDVVRASELAEGWLTLHRMCDGDAVRSARTCFVPTVYYRMGRKQASQALALADHVRDT
ncbi:nucleotidyltransferase family protein [Streptomyces prunicolor]|uniref:nucleotidyltransferase family protein n=1 Tax=Streptomyces prunicolor TaxID=67348 RepID=UPI00344A1CEC